MWPSVFLFAVHLVELVVELLAHDAAHHGPSKTLLRSGVPVLSQSIAPSNIPINCNVLVVADDSTLLPQAHRF